jgi:hypothetical protein
MGRTKLSGEKNVASDLAITAATASASVQKLRGPPAATAASSSGSTSQVNDLTSQSPPPVNPGLHVDLALNVVVLQFFDAQGQVTQSIPSTKQLQAYQQSETDKANPVSTLL